MAEVQALPVDLTRALTRKVGRAIQEFRMIGEGDRVMVAVSGGKDSYALLDLLEKLRRRSPVRFEIVACNVDQGYAGFRSDVIEDHLKAGGYRYHIEATEIAGTIRKKMDPDDTHCSLCARLRRGVLYRMATELGCNKIALGHHADDIIETLLMLQFFQRHQIKDFLKRIEEGHPGIKASLLKAAGNVHLPFLMDPRYLPDSCQPLRALTDEGPSFHSM